MYPLSTSPTLKYLNFAQISGILVPGMKDKAASSRG